MAALCRSIKTPRGEPTKCNRVLPGTELGSEPSPLHNQHLSFRRGKFLLWAQRPRLRAGTGRCPASSPPRCKSVSLWIRLEVFHKYLSCFQEQLFLLKSKIIVRIVWYCHKNKHMGQWNRMESPEINPCIYSQLIYSKGAKNIQWKKGQSRQSMVSGKLNSHIKKWNWTTVLQHTQKLTQNGLKT